MSPEFPIEVVLALLHYAAWALVGGAAYILVHFENVGGEDFVAKVEHILRRLAVSFIAGLVFYWTGLPNTLNSIAAGYLAPDWLDQVLGRARARRQSKA